MRKTIIMRLAGALALAALFLAAPAAPREALAQFAAAQRFEKSELDIRTAAGKLHHFRVEIARTPEQQTQGLMFRRRLAADAGMLFVYLHDERVRMWMKNTYIPLDMLFVDAGGRIVDIAERAVPHSLETIAASRPVRGVLEVNGGTVSRLGLRRGDRLVHPAFAPAP